VAYQDLLGEGPEGWHAAPRYPEQQVNCLIWLQLVLAEAYGNNSAERLAAMDCLRYYAGHPAFSLRKHYIDHWLAVDPAPLRPLSLQKWAPPLHHRSVIDPSVFLAYLQFPLPLYQMERRVFEFDYWDPSGILAAARALPSGCYVGFAVPNDAYLRRYGTRSGPMGLVHGFILQLSAPRLWRKHRPLHHCTLHHASTSRRCVVSEPLAGYLDEATVIHGGYVLCGLDPDWNPNTMRSWDAEARSLWEREQRLIQGGVRRAPDRDFLSVVPQRLQ
jgi:hypothetical protein